MEQQKNQKYKIEEDPDFVQDDSASAFPTEETKEESKKTDW